MRVFFWKGIWGSSRANGFIAFDDITFFGGSCSSMAQVYISSGRESLLYTFIYVFFGVLLQPFRQEPKYDPASVDSNVTCATGQTVQTNRLLRGEWPRWTEDLLIYPIKLLELQVYICIFTEAYLDIFFWGETWDFFPSEILQFLPC